MSGPLKPFLYCYLDVFFKCLPAGAVVGGSGILDGLKVHCYPLLQQTAWYWTLKVRYIYTTIDKTAHGHTNCYPTRPLILDNTNNILQPGMCHLLDCFDMSAMLTAL